MSDPKKWTIRKLVIHLDIEQMQRAILKEAGIELNENECYLTNIELVEDGEYWEITLNGAE